MTGTVAVMQPYFFPYGGYFSLIRAVDHFVFFDCVQFPRRGWVHRNRVPGPSGKEEWLTLPLMRQSRSTLIRDLLFAENAEAELARRLQRYAWLFVDTHPATVLRHRLYAALPSPVNFLASTILLCAELLGLNREFSLSSSLEIDPAVKGQDRIIAAVKAVGGKDYVNLAGGRDLYDSREFKRHALKLLFLDPFRGSSMSALYRLCVEPIDGIVEEIDRNSRPRAADA